MNFRSLMSVLAKRIDLSEKLGLTFGGRRDFYQALGYKKHLTAADYRVRAERDGMASAIVRALPKATWRGGGDIIEDPNPLVVTKFEEAWMELNKKLNVWATFSRADILAGVGDYSVIIIGGPGAPESPLKNATMDDIRFLTIRGESEASIGDIDYDTTSERYGLPLYYNVARLDRNRTVKVHYSRVIHVADDILDDDLRGTPRLKGVWNNLDDLVKVVGGGAEAFWKRADQGIQVDIDKEIELGTEDEEAFEKEVEEYEHGLRRVLRTQGTTVNSLGSDVANFSGPADAVISLISSTTGIPKRILLGSERGELGSSQDKNNWDERVETRRTEWAEPYVVRVFVDRMIEIGVLPQPKDYRCVWPQILNLPAAKKAEIAEKWSRLNSVMGRIVVTSDEIRTVVLGLDVLSEEQYKREKELVEKMREFVIDPNADQNGDNADSNGDPTDPKNQKNQNKNPKVNSKDDPGFKREKDGV